MAQLKPKTLLLAIEVKNLIPEEQVRKKGYVNLLHAV
jgi:hypothetical protein